MTSPKKQSLADYAAAKAPPSCRVCILPERAELDENYRKGVSRRLIHAWLMEECGYKPTGMIDGVSETALDKHFKNQHHHKKDA